MTRNETENIMNWELELIGMKKGCTEIPYHQGDGEDTNFDFFKNEDEFDETIYKFLNGTRNEYNYKTGRRKINYLKGQGKIL